jgi:hypothetical protein
MVVCSMKFERTSQHISCGHHIVLLRCTKMAYCGHLLVVLAMRRLHKNGSHGEQGLHNVSLLLFLQDKTYRVWKKGRLGI